tara:strand:- start:4170 stop:13517 length:9348 start_codon:yes stop_codon:yes gene_type:complete
MSNALAGSSPLVGPTFFNSAARTQEIPLIAESAMTQDTLMSLIDEVQSRLWVYDAGDNVAWNAGTFTHRGRGIGVGAGTFSVGCSYNIGHLWDPGGYWGTNALGTNGRYTVRTNLPFYGNSQYLNQAGNGLRTGCGGYFGVSSGVLPNPGSLQNIIPSGGHQAYDDSFYSSNPYDGYKCTQQPDFTNVSINTYRYDIGNGSIPITHNTNNEHAATGFTKTPLTTYRIVDKDGYLLGAPTADNFPAGTQPRHPSGNQIGCGSIFNGGNNCLGDGITYISDNEFLVTTINGVWYTNTKWKYAGSSIKHRTKNNAVTATPATPGNDGRLYVNHSTGINDLSAHSYSPGIGANTWGNMGRTFEDAWYACSYETGYKVETLIAVLVADLSIISEAMGDQGSGLPMDFNGATPSFPVIPTGAITFINAEHPGSPPSTCTPPTTRRPQVTLSVQYADGTQSNNRATTSYEILLPLTDPAMQNVGWVYNGTNAVDYVNSSPIGGVGQNATLINSCPGAILPTTMSGATGYLATWSIPQNGTSVDFELNDWFLIGNNINPDQTPSNSEITRYVSAINSSNDINGTVFQSPYHENYDSPPTNSFGAGVINFRAWPGPGNVYLPAGTGPSMSFPFANLDGAKAASSLQFWGVGQCPSCVYTSIGSVLNVGLNSAGNTVENTTLEGHYECSIHGCISSWGLGEVTPQFTSFAACSASCISYSCTSCCSPVTYDCPPIAGTGQTGTWLAQEDCDNNCGPQYHICTPIGCSGTTDTTAPYSSFTHCFEGGFGQPACESFGCEDNGCIRQDGTGGTWTTITACTGTCFSYACQDGTCKPWNEPWYGSGGTYFDVRSPLSALTACTASTIPCVAWACGQSYIPVDTDIYVYYDTTSMSLANAQVAHNSIEQWAAQIPGYLGTVRHINMGDERWVSWATIPYQQPTPRGLKCGLPATPIRRPQELRAWSQSQSSASRWYDGFGPGCNPSFVVNGTTHSFVGWPPLANPNKHILNVLFTDESDSPPGAGPAGTSGIYYDVNRTSTTAPPWSQNPALEPSEPFKDDYTRYMSVWNTIQSAGGTVASFVYPTKPVNYNYWGSGTVSVFKYQALTIVAAIDSGNNVPQDGTWSGGTAPRRAGQGGVVSCTNSTCATLAMPPLCTICDLTQLETSNVYWNGLTPTWGGLDKFGWGYNASFPQLTWQQMQTDLETFIESPVVIGASGCQSATTSPNAVYPYSGQVECLDFCVPKYECLSTGCILNSTGGTYDSMSACTGGCQSYSCSTSGCELWNPPSYGTGGTFLNLVNCEAGCISWNCEDVGQNNQYIDGCIQQVGTGGTYFNVSNISWALSACTATCTSWDCMFTSSQCTQYPNTGFTYSTSGLCEASPACGGGWECTISGCILHTGTPPSGANFYPSSASCIEHCVGWGCSADTIPSNTNFYVYYGLPGLGYGNSTLYRDWLASAHTSVMNYVAGIAGFTGKVYHTAVSSGRWLSWANSVYTGSLPEGLRTYNNSLSTAVPPCGVNNSLTPPTVTWASVYEDTMRMIHYGSQQVNSAYWYDDIVPANYTIPGIASSVTAKGLPPTAHTSGNTLVIVFNRESIGNPWTPPAVAGDCGYSIPPAAGAQYGYWYGSGAYHNGQGVPAAGLYPDRVPQFSGGSVLATYQPTPTWKKDYTGFTVNYSAVTGNSGTCKSFMFTPPVSNVPNAYLNIGDDQVTYALHSLAAITRGNNTVADGKYILGTAPRMGTAGGTSGGVPEICGTGNNPIEFGAVLTALETNNPYWNQPAGTSYGRLYEKKWGIDISYDTWTDQRFNNALNPFLKSVSTAIITGTCVSAETLYTTSTQYPYSSETWCTGQCGSSEWLYICTATGCKQDPAGNMTLSECLYGNIVLNGYDFNGCSSYSCGTQGCQLYNQPPTPPIPGQSYYGTGGTFVTAYGPNALQRCYQMCSSFVCNWDPAYMSYDDEGCKGVVGTGLTNTFPSLSACTGTCVSWDCNNPCDLQNIYAQYKPSGCTEYPNTGSTYTSSTACTDSCIRNWFCYSGSGIYNVTPQNGPFGPFPSNMANFSCATAVDIVPAVNDINAALELLHTNNGFGVANWVDKQIGTWRFSQLLNNAVGAMNCDSPYGGSLRIAKAITVQQLSGAFYSTWNDFITAAQGLNASITLSHTPSSVLGLLNASTYMSESTNCVCNSSGVPCTIDCSNTWPVVYTPSNPTPPVGATIFNGPYVTYSAASGVCCTGITVPTTSWSCKTGTDENSCDGLTLIPIPLTTVYDCYNWLTTNFPGGWFSGYTCELITPPVTSTQCAGPNGGQLINLTEMTFQTDLNSSVTGFSNWNNFISHASTQLSPAVTNIVSGQDIYTLELNTLDVYCDGHFSYKSTGCTCTETACGCVELQNTSGPYTSQTHCQLSCCTSGTSWNCINSNVPFQPICTGKTFVGEFNNDYSALDYYRVNAPSSIFGLDRLVVNQPISIGAGGNHLTFPEAMSNVGVNVLVEDCYHETYVAYPMPPGSPFPATYFKPYKYINEIRHTLVNGGFGYHTWNSWRAAVVTAGVSLSVNDTAYDVCTKINAQLNSGNTPIPCTILLDSCCRQSGCYCYELFTTGGTYTNEPDCLTVCCPPASNYECTPPQPGQSQGACNATTSPIGPNVYPTYNQCISACTGTTWYCFPGGSVAQVGGTSNQQQIPGAGLYPDYYSNTSDCSNVWQDFFIYLADWQAVPSRQYQQFSGYTTCLKTIPAPPPTSLCACGTCGAIFGMDSIVIRWSCWPTNGPYTTLQNTAPYHQTSNPMGMPSTWAEVIEQLQNVIAPGGTFNLQMSYSQVEHAMMTALNGTGSQPCYTFYSFAPRKVNCIETNIPCNCYPCYNPNVCAFSSYTQCIIPCCPTTPITYNCEINGCINPLDGSGTFSGINALIDCQAVCWEWECDPGTHISKNCNNLIDLHPVYGPVRYDYGYDYNPPWLTPTWVQGGTRGNLIIDLFGNPNTLPSPHNILNSVTGMFNLQEQALSHYTLDSTLGWPSALTGMSTSNWCDSLHGKRWRPSRIGILNRTTRNPLSPTMPVTYVGPWTTYYDLIYWLVNNTNWCQDHNFPMGYCLEGSLLLEPWDVNNKLITTNTTAYGTGGPPMQLLNGELWLYGEPCLC